MLRIKFQMEQMKSEVEQCVKRVESIKVEVSDQMTTNQQEFEKGFNVRMEEVSNFTAVAKAKLHELQDFKDMAITPTIAFKARLNVDTAVTTIGQTIVFPTVIFNEESAYKPNTGKFTAPVNWTYMFSLAFCVYSSQSLVVSIMIEGTKKYDTQDQQGKAAFNERNPYTTSIKNQWQGAQADPKQKQDRARTVYPQRQCSMVM
ncbi:uncharacterized protein LOC132727365 [Ruditapes philippinarum]|uniref:uncharacterized protein LOC132727365 n=1 Tax=Ruditapes philippinarum TaxID=129788 RepID=UPI00295BBD1D|nr:uncharacterized protein LOC132727365 [Ruditapes philippinarum]